MNHLGGVLIPLALLGGCWNRPNDGASVQPVDEETTRRLLPFLADLQSTKGEIEQHLGLPSSRFDHGRVSTHRLMLENEQLLAVGRETVQDDPRLALWEFAQFSLVLVFDETGVLLKHRLLQVR